jgi:hypothetical protein
MYAVVTEVVLRLSSGQASGPAKHPALDVKGREATLRIAEPWL